jgi:hypothetical protein
MNDCESMIIDQLKEVKQDVKSLLLDVNGLKVKSAIWGVLGGLIFTILVTFVPLVWNKLDTPKASASPTMIIDTTKNINK